MLCIHQIVDKAVEERVKTDCMRANQSVLQRLAITAGNCVCISSPFQVLAKLTQADSQGNIGCDSPQVSEEEEAQEVTLSADAECPEEGWIVCKHFQKEAVDEHIE